MHEESTEVEEEDVCLFEDMNDALNLGLALEQLEDNDGE